MPWCAPGQLLGEPCTPATDIFALGVILWELCTGQQTTARRSYRAVDVSEEAPEAISQLIMSCMSFKPEDRPTASEAHNTMMSCGVRA